MSRTATASTTSALAIFDVDGTLTDTTGVDDECYRDAVADALGLPPSAIDWSGAAHVTDSGIFEWLCAAHRQPAPTPADLERARSRFFDRLGAALATDPARFTSVPGAPSALRRLAGDGWHVAIATGGWGPSARLKLHAADIHVNDAVLACADDAMTRVDIVGLARSRAEEHYGRRFDRVVSIGDGVWDVKAAAELGLPFIGIGTGERAMKLRHAGAAIVLSDYMDEDAFRRALESATAPPLS